MLSSWQHLGPSVCLLSVVLQSYHSSSTLTTLALVQTLFWLYEVSFCLQINSAEWSLCRICATTPHKRTGLRQCLQTSRESWLLLVHTWTSNLWVILSGVYTLSNNPWLGWILMYIVASIPQGAWTCHAVPNTQSTLTAAPPFWPLLKTTRGKCLRFLALLY